MLDNEKKAQSAMTSAKDFATNKHNKRLFT
jgi:hypothetical protein